jgi:SAM-dependent methyltransferase
LQEYYDSFHLSEQLGGVYDEVEDRVKVDFPSKVAKVLSCTTVKNPRLLDVGCGKGFFVKAALDGNICAEGIDISRSGIDHAVNVLGVKATAGLIEEHCSGTWHQAFDVVTFWATIEHLKDPMSVLRAIYDCLKPGGIFLFDTGLGHVLWERFLPGHSQWYDAPQHLFVFSRKGLVALLQKSAFDVIDVDTNYDRSTTRRWMRWARHAALCVSGCLLITPLLGRRGLLKMKQEAKWPIGRLVSVVARKR